MRKFIKNKKTDDSIDSRQIIAIIFVNIMWMLLKIT